MPMPSPLLVWVVTLLLLLLLFFFFFFCSSKLLVFLSMFFSQLLLLVLSKQIVPGAASLRRFYTKKRGGRVRDLHKLQEQARPSDAKLFYADVEKQIETSTAATLEGFVAMHTKSIHNSVKEWADTATRGVKTLIGWIRTGGKNNRNIIEREEDRQRQRFKNEQYKKPRKKKKGRDSTMKRNYDSSI